MTASGLGAPQAGSDTTQTSDDATKRVVPPPDVVKTIVERYYTRGVDAADRTRRRSERGYTIASAIAATLVAAGLLTHLEERPVVVQVLGLAGLGLWLLAALLFMWAVAVRVSVPEPEGYKNQGEFVIGVAQQLREEVRVLNPPPEVRRSRHDHSHVRHGLRPQLRHGRTRRRHTRPLPRRAHPSR